MRSSVMEGGSQQVLPRVRAETELRSRRRRITDILLAGMAVLGGVAYVPSVWAAVLVGAWSIVVLDTVVYAVIVWALIYRGLGDRLRAGIVVAVAAVLGVTLSIMFGPNGAGALYLTAVPVLTALLLDRRTTIRAMILVVVAFAGVAALRWGDYLVWDVTPGGVLLWLVISGNAVFIAVGMALAVLALIGGLIEAAERAEEYAAALSKEQEDLLEANDRLERAIADRSKAEARLRQSEKLTAIGTLASGIAHDMNNLLVPIMTSAELLRAEEVDDGHRTELLDRTIEAANAGRELVQRILAFSRPGGEGRQPLPAGPVFRDATRLLRAAIPANVTPVFRADGDPSAVLLALGEAHQILLNLGTNAAHAMPDGGTITITVDTVEVPGGDPGPGCAPGPEPFVRLTVADTGVGMDHETQDRMYDPFFTGWDHATGHGVGLATVHGIVSSAGGFIGTRSAPGEGTTIDVFLPRVDAPSSEPVADESGPDQAGNGERILVVDDEESVRVVVSRVLKRAGYRVTTLEAAGEAVRRVRAPGAFDLLITDQGMPDMEGLELAAALRAVDPSLPTLLISGVVEAELRARAAAEGVVHLLPKPFRVHQLTRAVSAALADGRGPRPGDVR